MEERVKLFTTLHFTLYQTIQSVNPLSHHQDFFNWGGKFENNVVKRRNYSFFPFPAVFSTLSSITSTIIIWATFEFPPANTWTLYQSDKISDWSKSKAFTEDNSNISKKMISLYDRVETLWAKEKMLVTNVFLLFPQCLPKASSTCR